MRKAGGDRKGFADIIQAGLVNCDKPEYTSLRRFPSPGGMLTPVFQNDGYCTIRRGSEEGATVGLIDLRDETTNEKTFVFRVLHAGGRDEVWINTRRIYYAPSAERPKRIGFHLGAVGMRGELKIEFYKIGPG